MVCNRSPLFLSLVALAALSACDSGGGTTGKAQPDATATSGSDTSVAGADTSVAADTGATTTTQPDTTVVNNGCGRNGFTAAAMNYDSDSGFAVLRATSATSEPLDSLSIEIYQGGDYTGATEPGTYEINDPNYATCSNCVLIRTGCTSANGCEKTFYADAGTMQITQWDVSGGRFKGTLTGLELKEVTIDSDTFVSTEVEGGETWCIESFPFDAEVKALPVSDKTQAACVTEGTGNILHDNVGDLTLKNCNGEPVHLHATCANESRALWLIGTTGWCTACHEFIDAFRKKHAPAGQANTFMLDRAAVATKTAGLDMLIILAENNSGEKPTLEFCKAYAEDMHLDPNMVVVDWADREVTVPLIDPPDASITTNALGRTWTFINPYLTADSSGSVTTAYPWWAILDPQNMSYMWSDNAQLITFDQVLEDLLGRFPSELF